MERDGAEVTCDGRLFPRRVDGRWKRAYDKAERRQVVRGLFQWDRYAISEVGHNRQS